MALYVASVKNWNKNDANGHSTIKSDFINTNSVQNGKLVSTVDKYAKTNVFNHLMVYGYQEV